MVLFALVVLSSSCMGLIDLNENQVCDYSVRLRYDYNVENTSSLNMIDYHVRSLEEYIFDEEGVLIMTNMVYRDVCDGSWHSDLDLPVGRYSVIAVGNRDTRSRIWDERRESEPLEGVTKREDMRMELDNAEELTGDTHGPSEKLYHGYRTFNVEAGHTGVVRVDVVHSHLRIKFRVTWKNSTTPSKKQNYFAQLETVPSHYTLMPEYHYPTGSFECRPHDPRTSDNYERSSDYIIHHIPTVHQDRTPLTYRHDTYINNDNEMWGEFTAYRVKNETAVELKLYHWDEQTKTTTDLLDSGIDLQDFLTNHLKINLNHTLKQDYYLKIEIYNGKAVISWLSISDWDEGGVIPT